MREYMRDEGRFRVKVAAEPRTACPGRVKFIVIATYNSFIYMF
jgi:hypothetical protein